MLNEETQIEELTGYIYFSLKKIKNETFMGKYLEMWIECK